MVHRGLLSLHSRQMVFPQLCHFRSGAPPSAHLENGVDLARGRKGHLRMTVRGIPLPQRTLPRIMRKPLITLVWMALAAPQNEEESLSYIRAIALSNSPISLSPGRAHFTSFR
jgi:hypothetical protein